MVVPKRQNLFAEVTKRTLHTFKRLKLLCGSYEKANRISPNLKPESSYRQIYLETLLLCGDVRELSLRARVPQRHIPVEAFAHNSHSAIYAVESFANEFRRNSGAPNSAQRTLINLETLSPLRRCPGIKPSRRTPAALSTQSKASHTNSGEVRERGQDPLASGS